MQSEPEMRLWVAEGTANGMRPWVTKFSGVLYDRRWLAGGRAHLRVALRSTNAICATKRRSRASRCSTRSRPRRSTPARADGDRPTITCSGMYHALVEARVPFEMVHEAHAHAERLDRLQAADSRRRGGAVRRAMRAIRALRRRAAAASLATFASSLYDERGARRDDFGLADLFGVSFAGRIDGPMQNSYLSLDADRRPAQRHAMLDGLDGTSRIINGVFRVRGEADGSPSRRR